MNLRTTDSTTTLTTFRVTAGDLNIYHARSLADQQITYVLEFSGLLALDRLQNALALVHGALPILSSILQVKGTHFERVRIQDSKPQVRVAACDNPREEIVRFTGAPCDPGREPPLKLLLLQNNGAHTLCLKIDHTVSDAGGLKYLVHLVATAYTRGVSSAAINHDRGLRQVFRRFSPLALARAVRQANLPRPGAALVDGPFQDETTFVEHVSLAPSQFGQVHKEAKQAGATINDALLAALYQAIFKQAMFRNSPTGYPVMVPIDMRRYLPERERGVVANLSSAVYPSLAEIPNESFQDTLERVKASMDRLKQQNPGLGALLLMAIGSVAGGKMMRDRYQLAAAHGSRFINFTNFGTIDSTGISFGDVPLAQVYGVGPIQYPPGILIALSTYQDTLHFVVQGRDARRFQPFVRKFLDTLVDALGR